MRSSPRHPPRRTASAAPARLACSAARRARCACARVARPPPLARQLQGHLRRRPVVFFSTDEAWSPATPIHELDVYARSYDEALERYRDPRGLGRARPAATTPYPPSSPASPADGTEVFFSTKEPLVRPTATTARDIYMRDLSDQHDTLVSRGARLLRAGLRQRRLRRELRRRAGSTADGKEVFFVTEEQLATADDDMLARRLRARPRRRHDEPRLGRMPPGAGAGLWQRRLRRHLQRRLDRRLERRLQQLRVAGRRRRRRAQDIYARDLSGRGTQLVSIPGTCPATSTAKPSSAASRTTGPTSSSRAASDLASRQRQSRTSTTGRRAAGRCSPRSARTVATVAPTRPTPAASADGAARLLRDRASSSSPPTKTTSQDVYERTGGATTLVSTGPEGGNGAFNASLRWVSPDGSSRR